MLSSMRTAPDATSLTSSTMRTATSPQVVNDRHLTRVVHAATTTSPSHPPHRQWPTYPTSSMTATSPASTMTTSATSTTPDECTLHPGCGRGVSHVVAHVDYETTPTSSPTLTSRRRRPTMVDSKTATRPVAHATSITHHVDASYIDHTSHTTSTTPRPSTTRRVPR